MHEMVEGKDRWPIPSAILGNGDADAAGAVDPDTAPIVSSVQPRAPRRVLLGVRDLVFQQEVLDFLERDPRLDVVAAVTWPGTLLQGMRDLAPDVAVACPAMVRELSHPSVGPAPNLMVVAEEMTVPVLRQAIDAGARGVFAWPEERADLAEEISKFEEHLSADRTARGLVIAVYGTRGGAGATFVATQLAASFADRGQRSVLVDLDSGFADVTIALGVDPHARTIADLIPVAEELGPDHLEDVLYPHPRGFSVLLAPTDASDEVAAPGLYPASIALLAGAFEVIVLHLPRGMGKYIRATVGMADQVVLLVAPDLFSLHAARRAVDAFGLEDQHDRCRVVLNPAVRSQVGRREIERVLGMAPFAAVRYDPAVARVQAQSRLLPPRGRRAARDLRVLAGKLLAASDVSVARPHSTDGQES
jgi:Flp pilus assembly CpaE family ATPase